MATAEQRQAQEDKDESIVGDGGELETVIVTDDGESQCPYCKEWFKGLSYHWSRSDSCQYPPISRERMDLLRGMVLGDGSIHREKGSISYSSVNKTAIEWLDHRLGWLTSGVRKRSTAVEQVKGSTDRGTGGWSDDPSDYYDVYSLLTRQHPALPDYGRWYRGGKTRFPESLSLTPNILKMWYVGDGNIEWNWSGGGCKVSLMSANFAGNSETVASAFEDCGFELRNSGSNFRLLTDDTSDFFECIGEPVPGYEYKWEYEDKNRYVGLKDRSERQNRTQTLEDD